MRSPWSRRAGNCPEKIPPTRAIERFLASGRTPLFRVGVRRTTVGIVQAGDQITVSADGHLLTQFTDTRQPYMTGAFGFYSEDAHARFDHVRLFRLPASPQAPRSGSNPPSATRPERNRGNGPRSVSRTRTRWHSARRRVMVIYGTRPEAVKVAPLIRALDESTALHAAGRRHRAASVHARPGQRGFRDQARIRPGHPSPGPDTHRHHHQRAARGAGGAP